MPRPPDPHGKPADKARSRIPQPHLAVLVTDHPPAGNISLVPADEETKVKYRFTPLHYYADRLAQLGLIETSGSGIDRLPSFQAEWVQRGRRGGKSPEQLYILGKAPDNLRYSVSVQAEGLYRALGRAHLDAAGDGDAGLLPWWLAVEFIRRGFILRSKVTARIKAAEMAAYDPPGRVVATQSWLIWQEFLERCAGEIVQRLQQGKPNPLLSAVTMRMVRRRFELPDNELAEPVLTEFAQQTGLSLDQTAPGPVVQLTGDLMPATITEVDATAVTAVLKLLEEGHAAGYNGLLKAAPSQPHVVAWLFDADRLIESPDGYVFTAEELDGYLAQLTAAGIAPAAASIREIKDHLGLARRVAEGLRAWLVAAHA